MKKVSFLIFFAFILIVNVFSGPFGIEFGMSHGQLQEITGRVPVNLGDSWYRITPPNPHELFETYLVQIHPRHGIFLIQAISRNISTNRHGAELRADFNRIASSLERIYGNHLRIDEITSERNIWASSEWFMHALREGDRELIAFWDRKEGSILPDDFLGIILLARAQSTLVGYLVIEYVSTYFERIEAEQDSVF